MRTERYFLDTNVLIYLVDKDEKKFFAAQALVRPGAVVSVQVLNEFISVARKKLRLSWELITGTLNNIRNRCEIVPVTLAMHEAALEIAIEDALNIYDALIVAAAQASNCRLLITEDLNHSQVFGGVTVKNPFT